MTKKNFFYKNLPKFLEMQKEVNNLYQVYNLRNENNCLPKKLIHQLKIRQKIL